MAPVSEGYWGKPTSIVDWCENNYETTFYAAEFWNTLTNLGMILLPLRGVYVAIRDGKDNYILHSHMWLILIGIGSWCFHMTLLYDMQLLDEVPMLWGSSVWLYYVQTIFSPPNRANRTLQIGLIAYCIIVTMVYVFAKTYLIFEVAYLLLVFSIGFNDFKLTKTPYLKYKTFLIVLSMYCLGLFVWLIDRNLCHPLTAFRSSLPFFLRPITQLHGWWHILAGYATACRLAYTFKARELYLKEKYSVFNGLKKL